MVNLRAILAAAIAGKARGPGWHDLPDPMPDGMMVCYREGVVLLAVPVPAGARRNPRWLALRVTRDGIAVLTRHGRLMRHTQSNYAAHSAMTRWAVESGVEWRPLPPEMTNDR